MKEIDILAALASAALCGDAEAGLFLPAYASWLAQKPPRAGARTSRREPLVGRSEATRNCACFDAEVARSD